MANSTCSRIMSCVSVACHREIVEVREMEQGAGSTARSSLFLFVWVLFVCFFAMNK